MYINFIAFNHLVMRKKLWSSFYLKTISVHVYQFYSVQPSSNEEETVVIFLLKTISVHVYQFYSVQPSSNEEETVVIFLLKTISVHVYHFYSVQPSSNEEKILLDCGHLFVKQYHFATSPYSNMFKTLSLYM